MSCSYNLKKIKVGVAKVSKKMQGINELQKGVSFMFKCFIRCFCICLNLSIIGKEQSFEFITRSETEGVINIVATATPVEEIAFITVTGDMGVISNLTITGVNNESDGPVPAHNALMLKILRHWAQASQPLGQIKKNNK